MDGSPVNDVCSICHHNFHIPCQANCSHWFCGGCILQVWDHGPALRPCKCPLCRREITLLVPSEAHHTPDVAEILQRIERYNHLYGARPNNIMQRMQDLPFLLKRLSRDILDPQRSLPLVMRARVYLAVKLSLPYIHHESFGDQLTIKLPQVIILLMILSAMYVLSPVDIIPEALLGIIGLLDDLIVVFICFLYVAALYRNVLVTRHGRA